MKVERITRTPAEFLLPDHTRRHGWLSEWNELAGDLTQLDSDWLLSWWVHFGGARELCLLAVRDDEGMLHGLAPWYLDRSPAAGGVIRYLGSGVVCTDYLTILTRRGSESQVVDAVADWLLGAGRDCWERIELVGTDDADVVIPQLMRRLVDHGNSLHTRPGANTWRLTLPPTWDEYLAGMSGRRRNRVRKVVKTEFDTGVSVLRETQTAEEFEANWRVFIELHQARRRSVGDPGVFARPDFAAFLREAAERLFAKDELDLLILDRHGRPISVEFNPAGRGIVFGYQAGIDPAALDCQPGHLMTLARIRRAIGLGKTALDFMRGDERYKAEWGATKRTTTEYRLVQQKPIARLRHGMWLASQQMRQLAKSGIATAHQMLGKE